MNRLRRRLSLVLFVCVVLAFSISVYAISEPKVPAAHSVTATLVIDFNQGQPSMFAGHHVTWHYASGRWTMSSVPSSATVYVFENVTVPVSNVWTLMNYSSHIMLITAGSPLSIEKVYYPEYSDYFITSIEGVQNSNSLGLYWQYTVNGTLALYGVLHQSISDGSVVEWFYGTYSGQ